MSERAPYSRVYWSVADDPKFAGIYDDDPAFALWTRLLMAADALWPAPAPLPRRARPRPLSKLVDAGLVDLMPGDRYRIHGLDAERGRRGAAARRDPDRTQTDPKPDPDRDTDKTRRDTTSQDDARAPDDGRVDLEAFLMLRRRAPTTKQRAVLDDVLQRRDETGPQWAADIMYRHPDDPIGAVIEADKEWREARIAEAQAQEKPKTKPRRRSSLPESTRDLLEHWAATTKTEVPA